MNLSSTKTISASCRLPIKPLPTPIKPSSHLTYLPHSTTIQHPLTPATRIGLANPLLNLAVPKTNHSLTKCTNAMPQVHMHNSYATLS